MSKDFDLSAMIDELAPLAVEYALNLLTALAILVIGVLAANWASRVVTRAVKSTHRIDPTLAPMVAQIVRYGILALVLVAVLAEFGVQTASIIAVLGAAGLAIGLALQGTLANIAAGLMLLSLRPFRVGDYIDAEGIGGTVDSVGLFITEMRTADGVFVSVPNSQLWNRVITNYNRHASRRLVLTVGIGYDDSIDAALEVLRKTVEADIRVLSDPAPQYITKSLGDSAVVVEARAWAATVDYWATYWDLIKAIKLALDQAGISIPYPQRDVHIYREDDRAADAAQGAGAH